MEISVRKGKGMNKNLLTAALTEGFTITAAILRYIKIAATFQGLKDWSN